jgi:hypothetical protein
MKRIILYRPIKSPELASSQTVNSNGGISLRVVSYIND